MGKYAGPRGHRARASVLAHATRGEIGYGHGANLLYRGGALRTVPLFEVLEKRAYFAVTFANPATFALSPAASPRPPVVVAGNLSNDSAGFNDLLFAYLSDNTTPTNGTLAVAVNNGNGTFAAPVAFFNSAVITGVPV